MSDNDGPRVQDHSHLWLALQKLTNGLGVQRSNLLEALAGELSELQQCWGVNLNNGREVAINTIVANLRAHIDRLMPRKSRQKVVDDKGRVRYLTEKERREQYDFAIWVCFNMFKNAEFIEADLSGRQEWLAEDARGLRKVDQSTCRRDLRDAFDQIEQQILESGYTPVRIKDEETPPPFVMPEGLDSIATSPADEPPPRHRKRRMLSIAAGVGSVLILVAAVLLVVHPWTSSQAQPPTPPTGPLAVTITSLQSSLDGDSLAFPTSIAGKAATFETTYQNANGDLQPTFEQALQAGAYSFGSEVLNLQAHTNSDDQLVITGIHAVNIKRGPVATGTVIYNPGGAGGGPNIGFDLDQPTPDARTDAQGTLGTPYFQAQLLAVTKSAATGLELEFIGHGASYSFNVEIDYLDGQQSQHLILPAAGGSGQPFVGRVSGTLCDQPPNLSADALAQFKKLQYASVVQPVGNTDGTRTMQSASSADFKASSCTSG